MSEQVFGESWRNALDELGIEVARTGVPAGENVEWVEAMMRFSVHGFAMVFLRGEAGGLVRVRVHLALPAGTDSGAFGRELARRLETLRADDAVVTEPGPPAVMLASFSKVQEPEDIRSLLTLLLKVGDYVTALESDPDAPSPLEVAQDTPVAPAGGAPAAPAGFEPVGSNTAAPGRDEAPAPKPTGGAFEPIGSGAPAGDARPSSDHDGDAAADEVRITGSDVRRADGGVEALIRLNRAPTRAARRAIEDALVRTLRVRLDAEVRAVGAASDAAIALTARPASTQARREDVRDVHDGVESYLDRLLRFDDAGVSLSGALDLGAPRRAPRRDERRDDRRDERRRQEPPAARQERPAAGDGGFVLGFSSAPEPGRRRDEPSEAEEAGYVQRKDALEPKDFNDPRLKRPDAETPLVDVVLRHPGYSDRRIAQVLSILLSVDYPTARDIAEDAPCVILWGVDRERAIEHFQHPIDGAGGKVLLVEPNTFAPG